MRVIDLPRDSLMNDRPYIDPQEYLGLFSGAQKILQEVVDSDSGTYVDGIPELLDSRKASGLVPQQVAVLLKCIGSSQFEKVSEQVILASREVRVRCFGDDVVAMAPVEYSSFCSSSCLFCGWRSDNKEMNRFRISAPGLDEEIVHLVKQGIGHIELVGGDDLKFLRRDLYATVDRVKSLILSENKENKLSICLTPLRESHYERLKSQHGLDSVLTWQETYDQRTYYQFVGSGPKKFGIDDNFLTLNKEAGFLSRLQSQEWAIRAGLQIGIGSMIGLAEDPLADILSVVLHGRLLLSHYTETMAPVIVGMPLWCPIPTSQSDLREALGRGNNWAQYFEYIAAVYLLAFPDRSAWVFPNGRVPLKSQLRAVKNSGCFTSTVVRVTPGGYRAEMRTPEELASLYESSTLDRSKITSAEVLHGEQFSHGHLSHERFLSEFDALGLRVIRENTLFSREERDLC